MTAATAAPTPAKRGFRTFGRAGWAVALIFAFLYAYHLWGGIANLIGVASLYSQAGVSPTGLLWLVLVAYAAAPFVLYAASLLVGRKLSNFSRVVVFVVGFTVIAVFSRDLQALACVEAPILCI